MAAPTQTLTQGDKIRETVLYYESARSRDGILDRFVGEGATLYDWPSQGALREVRRAYAITATVGHIAQEGASQLVVLSRCRLRDSEPWKTLPRPAADFLERRRRDRGRRSARRPRYPPSRRRPGQHQH
jgi:hypothetical protein